MKTKVTLENYIDTWKKDLKGKGYNKLFKRGFWWTWKSNRRWRKITYDLLYIIDKKLGDKKKEEFNL